MTDFYSLIPSAPKGRFDGIQRAHTAEDVKGCAVRWRSSIRWLKWAPTVCGS